mmetsp:Transcript_25872/g.77931  ORF Transcript_25872/g.77931 Transcript_25872/m.77931 type:complete len:316 (-) Transcript_25872:163-1110(-)
MGNSESQPEAPPDKLVAPLAITTIDVKELGDGKVSFSKESVGDKNNVSAQIMKNVVLASAEDASLPIYEATEVADAAAFRRLIEAEAKDRGATHCMLYIHGFTNTPGVVFEAAKDMNKYLEGKKCFVIPIIWPAEAVDYGAQKEGAPAAAAALRSLLPKLSNNNKVPISLMCHSMGNFLLGQFAPGDKDEAPAFKFDSIFMVASDIRATTFDKEEPDPEDLNRGDNILRIVKDTGHVHVLYHWWDMALLGRRVLNGGRTALGKVGFFQNPQEKKILADARIIQKDCGSFDMSVDRLVGHGYHTSKDAMEYYLANM